jgi:muconate cycloisomerase
MADESMHTPRDAQRLVTERAADLLSVKVAKCGGLSAVQRIAAIAETNGIACHGGTTIETSIGTSASAQLFAALPAVSAGCELFGPLLLADDVVIDPVKYCDGSVLPPSGPGLGVELDADKVRAFARP